MKLKIHFLPNAITAFGLSCGLYVIFKVNLLADDINRFELIRSSAILLLIAAIADVLDGAVARLTNTESSFGVVFDSLSDATTFGLAPPIILLQTINLSMAHCQLPFLLTTGAMVFSLCGVLRLVRYTVQHFPKDVPDTSHVIGDNNFTGLPIPAGAAGLVSATLISATPEVQEWLSLSENTRNYILVAIMFALGYLMISRWKFPSSKALSFRIRSFNVVFLTVLTAVFLLYGIHHHFPILLFAISWLYIIAGISLSAFRLIVGPKTKTFKDFDPEPEDLE